MNRPVVYDTGTLIAAGRAQRTVWHRHRGYLLAGTVPRVPAAAVVEAWRVRVAKSRLSLLLRGCQVVPLDHAMAREVGELLERAGTADPVDAAVVVLAARLRAVVPTSNEDGLRRLLARLGPAGATVTVVPA